MTTLNKWSPLTRWDPFKEMEELTQRLAPWLGRGPGREAKEREAMTVTEWTPVVDITEDEKEYLIKAELPEVKKENVKVTVENGVLSISGERNFEKEEKSRKYHRVERAYGSFLRSFTLPEGTSPDKVTAEYKDGVMNVHLPKEARPKPAAVEVKVS